MSTLLFPLREQPARPSAPPDIRKVRIGLLGAGGVGQAFLQLCRREREFFLQRGLDLRPVSALVRDTSRPRQGLPPQALLTADPLRFLKCSCDVVVEALGGVEPSRTLVAHCLKARIPVVTANKSLAAAHGAELSALAQAHGSRLRVEAAAVAGVPFIGNLEARPLAGRFSALQGVLNGTSNYLLTRLSQGQGLEPALSEAQELGLAEPDPSNDLSGRDSAEKLTLLLQRLCARQVDAAALEVQPLADLQPRDLQAARRLGGVVRPAACAWLSEPRPPSNHRAEAIQAFVGPCYVPNGHPLSQVQGLENGLLLLKNAPHSEAAANLFYRGPGAGPEVTAATLLDDLWESVQEASDSRPASQFPAPQGPPATLQAPRTPWFLRLKADHPAELDDILAFLADHGLHGRGSHAAADTVWLLTSRASRARVEAVGQALAEAAQSDVLPLRALEVPHGC